MRIAERTALFAVALASLASACGTPEAGGEARERPVYRTGSNLPVKEPEEKSRTQVSAPATNPLPPVGMPPRPGG